MQIKEIKLGTRAQIKKVPTLHICPKKKYFRASELFLRATLSFFLVVFTGSTITFSFFGFGPGVYHESKGKGLSVALVTINTCVGASAPRHTMILSGSSYKYGCVAAG